MAMVTVCKQIKFQVRMRREGWVGGRVKRGRQKTKRKGESQGEGVLYDVNVKSPTWPPQTTISSNRRASHETSCLKYQFMVYFLSCVSVRICPLCFISLFFDQLRPAVYLRLTPCPSFFVTGGLSRFSFEGHPEEPIMG